jgi:hypothetical protein
VLGNQLAVLVDPQVSERRRVHDVEVARLDRVVAVIGPLLAELLGVEARCLEHHAEDHLARRGGWVGTWDVEDGERLPVVEEPRDGVEGVARLRTREAVQSSDDRSVEGA